MKKTEIFAVAFLLVSGMLAAQSPYQLSKKKEVFIVSGSIAALAGSYYFLTETKPLTDVEILTLNKEDINSVDVFATKKYSKTAGNVSHGLLASSFVAPIPLIFKQEIRGDFWVLAAMYTEAFSLTSSATLLAKAGTKRARPIVYNSEVGIDLKIKRGARHSFFSGHTSISAMNTFFFAKVFSDYYPKSRYKKAIWAGAVLLPAVTGYTRIEAGKHFPTDVVFGYAAGAVIGYFTPYFHKKERAKSSALQMKITPTGILVSFQLK